MLSPRMCAGALGGWVSCSPRLKREGPSPSLRTLAHISCRHSRLLHTRLKTSAKKRNQKLICQASKDGDGLIGNAVSRNMLELSPVKLSRSDEEFFENEGVEFIREYNPEDVSMSELNDLFAKVGFPRRDEEKLSLALDNTYAVVWIRAARKSRFAALGQIIGFARATSDGVFNATIWDVAVLPFWQGSGLGRAVLERLIQSLVEDGINNITLFAEPNVVGLYQKLDFEVDPNDTKGMAFRRPRY